MTSVKNTLCSKCEKKLIVNVKYQLCDDCNFERLHKMTKLEAAVRKRALSAHVKRQRIKKFSSKRKDVIKKDRDTYLEVFNSKPNVCEECGTELPDTFLDENGRINSVAQYSHILSKGSYPEFRNDERNFNRLCPTPCHNTWEFGDRKNMNIYRSNMKVIKILFDERARKKSH